MVDCSVCSIMHYILGCVFYLIQYIFDHPILLFVSSVGIAFVFVSNVEVGKVLSEIVEWYSAYWKTITDLKDESKQLCNIVFDYGPEYGELLRFNEEDKQSFINKVLANTLYAGPHNWQITTTTNQSPINILDDYVHKYPIRELLTWNHYEDLPRAVMLENTGHTVILRAAFAGNRPTISGADLLASYTFVELCFRWSINNSEGSEHMFNYRKFPLELQAMHRTGPDGELFSSYDIMMIAYVFEISAHNPYLDPVVDNLYLVQKPGSKVEIPPFPLAYLCHQFRTGFYSYGGSLTEPPCYQGAEWFIFPEPLAIGENQINAFRQLLGPDGKTKILRNARPVQPLNETRLVNMNQYNPLDSVVSISANECSEDAEAEEIEKVCSCEPVDLGYEYDDIS